MYSRGYGCGNGYTDGNGEWCGLGDNRDIYIKACKGNGYGVGIDGYDDGDGNGDGYEYGIGIEGDGRRIEYMEDEEEEQLSAIRLLSDDTQDINFYICQLQLLKSRSP
jgi:hypothetical protein